MQKSISPSNMKNTGRPDLLQGRRAPSLAWIAESSWSPSQVSCSPSRLIIRCFVFFFSICHAVKEVRIRGGVPGDARLTGSAGTDGGRAIRPILGVQLAPSLKENILTVAALPLLAPKPNMSKTGPAQPVHPRTLIQTQCPPFRLVLNPNLDTSLYSAAGAMRAITGAIVSSDPCSVQLAGAILSRFAESTASHLPSSDYATYLRTAADAAREHHRFLRFLGANCRQGPAQLDADGYEGPVAGAREHRSGEENGGAEVPAGGHHISAEEVKVPVAANEKKSKKRKMTEDPHEDKAAAGVASHASVEITSEQRKKKEKHSNKELPSVVIVKQELDLVVEEELGGESKKKRSNKELASSVKQDPDLFVEEELGSEKKKGKKKKEKYHVKSEEDVMEVKGQIVNNGVAEQGIADGGKKRKKKKHSEEEGDSKGVKEEEIMATAIVLYSEKKKKKRGRGDDDDNVQEQGAHKKKKQRKESRD